MESAKGSVKIEECQRVFGGLILQPVVQFSYPGCIVLDEYHFPRAVGRIKAGLESSEKVIVDCALRLRDFQHYRSYECLTKRLAIIVVSLDRPFDPSMLSNYTHCFNSMSIDEFFGYRFGVLPYRSIRFHDTRVVWMPNPGAAATVNFTDNGPLTRATDWSLLPNHRVQFGPHVTITSEEPCDHSANSSERYYPVKRSDGRNEILYGRYRALAEQIPKLTFIGRCGTYRYLDMHQVINQSLQRAHVWLEANGRVTGAHRAWPRKR